jgi:RHS repeat-associated protein
VPLRFRLVLVAALALFAAATRPAAAQGCTLVDCPNQAPTISVVVSPSSPTAPVVSLTVYASDAEGLATSTFELWVNGVPQSWWFAQASISNTGGTSLSASGTWTIGTGVTQFRAKICDVAADSLCAEQTVSVTLSSPPPRPTYGSPTAQLMQRTDARALGTGGSTLGYSTPTYVTVNTPRGVALSYSSEVVEGKAVVQVETTIWSQTKPTHLSLQVLPVGGGTPLAESYFLGDTGTVRMAARYAATCPGGAVACATKVDLRVRAHYAGAPASDTLKTWTQSNVRLLLLSPTQHPYGRGWALAGAERLFVQSDGNVVLWDGAQSLAFFTKTACTGSGATERCDYVSPEGDLTILQRRQAHPLYGTRFFRAGRGGDTTFYGDNGLLLHAKSRFQSLRTQLTWVSDTLGTRVASIIDPMSRTISLQYEPPQGGAGYKPGTLRFIYLPDGRRVEVRVDNATGNLTRVDGPDGFTDLTATYVPGTSRVQSWTERIGGGSAVYDARGLLAVVKGISVAFEGGTGADSVLVGTALGAALARAQASAGAASHVPLPAASAADSSLATDGSVTRVWTNASGLPTRTLSRGAPGDSAVTTISYNAAFQPLVMQTLGRAPVSYAYSGSPSRLASVTDGGSGTVTSYTYGPFDQVKTVHVNGTKMSEAFFATAATLAPDSVKSDSANVVRYKYDTFGRLRSARDVRQVFDTLTVEAAYGNTLSTTRSGPGVPTRTMTYAHDAAGRVWQVTDHLGRVSRVTYDSLGRVTREIRLATSTSPDTVLHTFNDATRTYAMRDPIANWYTEVRNAAGLTISSTDPRNQVTTFGYDRRGATVRTTDRRGTIVRDSLDVLGRVVKRKWASDSILFAYDPAKRWVAVQNGESTDTTFVDAAGRPTLAVTVRGGVRYELIQGWVGELPDGVTIRSYTTPNGSPVWIRSTGSGYDAQQRERVIQDFGGGATTTTFDSREMEKTIALPYYTMVRTNTIGTLGELQQQAYSGSAASLTRAYQFDASTRIAQIERGNWSDNTKRVHNYDSRDRLMDYRDVRTWVETVWEPWDPYGDCPGCMIQNDITHVDTLRSAAFGYDKNGNPSGSGITVDALGNRLMVFGGESFTYDAEGNLLQRTGGAAGTVAYTWNGLGQLVQVVSPQGTTTYGYDGWGQRVRKTVNGVQTRYLLHDDQVVMEVSAANAVLAEYTYYPGTDHPHGMRRGGAQYFFAQDGQGNVYGLMNPNGGVVETYEYTPQGAPIGGGSGVGNPYRWKGREWDAEAGLYYVRARYYDPVTGRFVSEDPIGTAGGLGLFNYGEGDHVNSSDPSGLFPGPCPAVMIPWGYSTVRSGTDSQGNPVYSCWRIYSLDAVTITAFEDPSRLGSRGTHRGVRSLLDFLELTGLAIPVEADRFDPARTKAFSESSPFPQSEACLDAMLGGAADGIAESATIFAGGSLGRLRFLRSAERWSRSSMPARRALSYAGDGSRAVAGLAAAAALGYGIERYRFGEDGIEDYMLFVYAAKKLGERAALCELSLQ